MLLLVGLLLFDQMSAVGAELAPSKSINKQTTLQSKPVRVQILKAVGRPTKPKGRMLKIESPFTKNELEAPSTKYSTKIEKPNNLGVFTLDGAASGDPSGFPSGHEILGTIKDISLEPSYDSIILRGCDIPSTWGLAP